MKTTWKLAKVDQREVDAVVQQFSVHPVIARLLVARGIKDTSELNRFFNGTFMDICSPFEIDGMKEAADLVTDAISKNERILVFGDYDVDGTTATVILLQLLKAAGANVEFFIPDRLDDGYGLSLECATRLLNEKDPDLVVSVDCGITAFEAISYFRENNVKFILTDHHLPVGGIPEANVVVNPKLCPGIASENCCGAVVSFKLALAIAQTVSGSKKVLPHLRSVMAEQIPLAALATVADVMPLRGENRLIVTKGLSMLGDYLKLQPGLKALLKNVGLDNHSVSSTDIGFKIAPRINAAGRISNASMIVELLCADSDELAQQLVDDLEFLNCQRREICEEVEKAVEEQVRKIPNYDQCSALVVAGADWHKGVIGVVASRFTEKYSRPVIIFTKDDDGTWCGSGRAVKGIDIKSLLDDCSDLLIRHGGHKGAAGLALYEENLPEFIHKFQLAVSGCMKTDIISKVISIDAQVEHDFLDMELAESMSSLEPFGEGNRKPVLLATSLSVADVRTVGSNRHLKARFATEYGTIIDAVGFNLGKRFEELQYAKTVDLVFFPSVNEWRGRRTLDLQIEDIRIVD